jgi:mannosyltransferase
VLRRAETARDEDRWYRLALGLAYGLAMALLVVPRLHSGSDLWLDEALSVNIARLPVPDLLAALRQDGSPPLYYLLLHAWMGIAGTGDDGVRAMSTVFSLAALPLAFLVGRRLGGTRVGLVCALLFAASPFAIRYATETRMYALVMLLALLVVLLVLRALERPTPVRLVLVALTVGLLALTHYWSLFFVAVTELQLLWLARRQHWQGAPVRVAVALPAGGLLFLPWLPSFVYQTQHTGTPWAPAPTWSDAVDTVRQWTGPGVLGLLITALIAALAVNAARTRAGRWLLALGLGTLALGLLVSRFQGSGYALRYSAAALIPVLVAAALGTARLRAARAAAAGGAVAALTVGLVMFSPLLDARTQAGDTATLLRAGVQDGDLVVYCPDQLGPAVSRLLPSDVTQVTYPTLQPPQRVDWVDYAERNVRADPAVVAAVLDQRTTGRLWLVAADHYLTFDNQCAELDQALADRRGGRRVLQRAASTGEAEYLVSYPARRSTDSSASEWSEWSKSSKLSESVETSERSAG